MSVPASSTAYEPLYRRTLEPGTLPRLTELQEKLTTAYNQRFMDWDRLRQEGTQISPLVSSPKAGYIIALRYPESVNAAVGEFSRTAARVIPGIEYHSSVVHTSLFVIDQTERDKFTPDQDLVRILVEDCVAAVELVQSPPTMKFGAWCFNRDTVILPGIPQTQEFVRLVDALEARLKQHHPNITTPSLAHTTVLRFREAVKGEQIEQLIQLCNHPAVSSPVLAAALDVGHFTAGPESFCFTSARRIEWIG